MKEPTMLYRCPGEHRTDGIDYAYTIVDADQVDAALAEGWHRTIAEAADTQAALVQKIQANESELQEVERKLAEGGDAPKLAAVHKGRGKYDVVDAAGAVVASGLTKDEAQAKAGG